MSEYNYFSIRCTNNPHLHKRAKTAYFCYNLECYERKTKQKQKNPKKPNKKTPEFWLEAQKFYDFFFSQWKDFHLQVFPWYISSPNKTHFEMCGIMNFSNSGCSNRRVEEKTTISFWNICHTVIQHAFWRKESIFWPQIFFSPVD